MATYAEMMAQLQASRSGGTGSPLASSPINTGFNLQRSPTTISATATGGSTRSPFPGSTNYQAPRPTTSPTSTSVATGTVRAPLPGSGNYQAPTGALTGFSPQRSPTMTGAPTGSPLGQLSQQTSAWNQYAPAANQASPISNYQILPDGNISYSFANNPGQTYTASPGVFNLMIQSMGGPIPQVAGTNNVPYYNNPYANTSVPGQYYGGQTYPYSGANQNYTNQGVISPYGAAGNSGTLSNMVNYWNANNQYVNQRPGISNYQLNPDGTVSYSLANDPRQTYNVSPTYFNSLISSMSGQVGSSKLGPAYGGSYMPQTGASTGYAGSATRTPTQATPNWSNNNVSQYMRPMAQYWGSSPWGSMQNYSLPQYIGVGQNQGRNWNQNPWQGYGYGGYSMWGGY